MIKSLYLIISHEADFESCTHSVIGACNALDLAVAKLQEHIAETFEDDNEWWEDENDENAINEQCQEWIDENYLDDEHLAWSYTDEDGIEYLFQIVAAEIESDSLLQEAFSYLSNPLLHCTNRIENCQNRNTNIGKYCSPHACHSQSA